MSKVQRVKTDEKKVIWPFYVLLERSEKDEGRLKQTRRRMPFFAFFLQNIKHFGIHKFKKYYFSMLYNFICLKGKL